MLALMRKIGERIVIRVGSEVITVLVVDVRGDKRVKLGFEAEPHVEICRHEIDARRQQERRRLSRG